MKKALSIILSLCIAAAILFVAVSCGKTETKVDPKTVYEYYENGNVKKSSDYDAKGSLKKQSYYDTEGKLSGYSVYEYDENGNKAKESCYDAEGNLIYSK